MRITFRLQVKNMKTFFADFIAIALSLSLFTTSFTLSSFADSADDNFLAIDLSSEEFSFDMGSIDFESFNMPSGITFNSSAFSKPDAHLYGSFLNQNNKAVYEALKTWVNPSSTPVTITFPEVLTISVSALPNSDKYTDSDQEIIKEAVMSNCKAGRDSVLFDYPEIFWLDVNSMPVNLASTSYKYDYFSKSYKLKIGGVTIIPHALECFTDETDIMNYRQQLDAAVYNFKVSGNNYYEQLSDIYQQIGEFAHYDINAAFAHTAVGALVDSGAVCEGYSKAFKLICDRLGIPCVLVFGNYNENDQTAHMWNYVLMEDKKWYPLDATWDDTDGVDPNEVQRKYFLKAESTFNSDHFACSDFLGTIFTYPTLSKSDFSTSFYSGQPVTQTATTTTSTTTRPITTTTSSTTTTTTSRPVTTTTTSATTTTTNTTTPFYYIPQMLKGDFNYDGKIDISDAVICEFAILGMPVFADCDINNDGSFDVFDFVAIRKLIIH